jgi:hypothetical protein
MMPASEYRYDGLPTEPRVSDHLTAGRAMLVTVAALSVETIVLTFLVPLTLMTALGGWCTDSDSYASCAARHHSADMTLLTLTVASLAIVTAAAYAAVRRLGGRSMRRKRRPVAIGLAVAFTGLLPVAAVGAALALGGRDDVPHLWQPATLLWLLLLGAWTIVLHRLGRGGTRRRDSEPGR